MKRIKFFVIVALVLPLLFALSGCSDDPPDSMSFIHNEGASRIIIYENFEFKVEFLDPPDLSLIGIDLEPGDWVTGKIKDVSSKDWKTSFEGKAYAMTSNSETAKTGLAMITEVDVVFEYYDSPADAVMVAFPRAFEEDPISIIAQMIMGGYFIKE